MKWVNAVLGAVAAAELCWIALDARRPAGVHWLAMAALVALSAYLCVHLRASLIKARFFLLLACFAVIALACGVQWWAVLAMLAGGWLLSRVRAVGELAAVMLLFLGVLLWGPA
ncbi:MAG TPA: hypothetical protein VLW85_10445 [Myxococcales bacterium]|nr:hypothetical protein [Myxococcales bacterium]